MLTDVSFLRISQGPLLSFPSVQECLHTLAMLTPQECLYPRNAALHSCFSPVSSFLDFWGSVGLASGICSNRPTPTPLIPSLFISWSFFSRSMCSGILGYRSPLYWRQEGWRWEWVEQRWGGEKISYWNQLSALSSLPLPPSGDKLSRILYIMSVSTLAGLSPVIQNTHLHCFPALSHMPVSPITLYPQILA